MPPTRKELTAHGSCVVPKPHARSLPDLVSKERRQRRGFTWRAGRSHWGRVPPHLDAGAALCACTPSFNLAAEPLTLCRHAWER